MVSTVVLFPELVVVGVDVVLGMLVTGVVETFVVVGGDCRLVVLEVVEELFEVLPADEVGEGVVVDKVFVLFVELDGDLVMILVVLGDVLGAVVVDLDVVVVWPEDGFVDDCVVFPVLPVELELGDRVEVLVLEDRPIDEVVLDDDLSEVVVCEEDVVLRLVRDWILDTLAVRVVLEVTTEVTVVVGCAS